MSNESKIISEGFFQSLLEGFSYIRDTFVCQLLGDTSTLVKFTEPLEVRIYSIKTNEYIKSVVMYPDYRWYASWWELSNVISYDAFKYNPELLADGEYIDIVIFNGSLETHPSRPKTFLASIFRKKYTILPNLCIYGVDEDSTLNRTNLNLKLTGTLSECQESIHQECLRLGFESYSYDFSRGLKCLTD